MKSMCAQIKKITYDPTVFLRICSSSLLLSIVQDENSILEGRESKDERSTLRKARPDLDMYRVNIRDFLGSFAVEMRDERINQTLGLSVLEMMILVSALKMMQIETFTYNYEMIYDIYRTFTKRIMNTGKGNSFHFVKPVVKTAFERLVEQGFFRYCGASGGFGGRKAGSDKGFEMVVLWLDFRFGV